MPQTFEDLAVEKEVAVRRRLAKEYVPNLSEIRQANDVILDSTKGEKTSPT